jgi:drug/metabolite transporter (DMT)-like permease
MGLGILLAILAAGCYECGYVLQALEARVAPSERAMRASLIARLAGRPRWVMGTLLAVVGAALQVAALTLAPVTLVQPVLALGLVVLLLFARTLLGERVGPREIGGVALVIAGVAAVGVDGPARSTRVTSVTALVLLLAPLALVTLLPYMLRARGPLMLAAAGAAAGDAIAAVVLKLAADAAARGRIELMLPALAGAAVSGGLALTAEMTALRGLAASRVAPMVLTAQVIVPAIAAVTAFGEPLTAPVALGVTAAGAGAALLGASGAVAGLRVGGAEPEAVPHDRGGGGQRGERVTG